MKKFVLYVVIIFVVAIMLSLNGHKAFSMDEVSIFLTVIGLIYGLIAAFSISNSRDKFSKIRDSVAEEISSLELLYTYSKYLTDQDSAGKMKNKILEYCKEVPEVDRKDYWKSDKTHDKFREIENLVASIRISNEKDAGLLSEISEELRDATSFRNTQLVLSQTKISPIQWTLNIFLSLILIVGLVFLNIPNRTVEFFFVASMIAAILMILLVIYEIDSLRFADNAVSVAPYESVIKLIVNDKFITSTK